jgi:hypothetical protein
MSLKTQLQRWQIAEIIDAATVRRLEAYEKSRHGFRFSTAMFGLGALAIVLGVAAVVGSNWDAIPATFKLIGHTLINLVLTAGILHAIRTERTVAREIMLFLLAGFTLTFIALIGQIYQTGAPLWQALALWLVITSPFLFLLTRAKFTIACWMLGFWTTLGAAAETVAYHLGPMHLDVAFYTLIPFLMIGMGEWRAADALAGLAYSFGHGRICANGWGGFRGATRMDRGIWLQLLRLHGAFLSGFLRRSGRVGRVAGAALRQIS